MIYWPVSRDRSTLSWTGKGQRGRRHSCQIGNGRLGRKFGSRTTDWLYIGEIMVRLACRKGRETLVLDKRERMDGRKAWSGLSCLRVPRTWGTNHQLALRKKGLTGLYVGTGAPWAGQDREKGRADAIDGVKVLVRAGNFGADPPTGSKRVVLRKLACKLGQGPLGLDKQEPVKLWQACPCGRWWTAPQETWGLIRQQALMGKVQSTTPMQGKDNP